MSISQLFLRVMHGVFTTRETLRGTMSCPIAIPLCTYGFGSTTAANVQHEIMSAQNFNFIPKVTRNENYQPIFSSFRKKVQIRFNDGKEQL